jgi:hypothetical protein
MSEVSKPLPWWGRVGRACFLLNFVATPTLTILETSDVINDDRGFWLLVRVVVAVLFTVGAIAWAIAAYLRQRTARIEVTGTR